MPHSCFDVFQCQIDGDFRDHVWLVAVHRPVHVGMFLILCFISQGNCQVWRCYPMVVAILIHGKEIIWNGNVLSSSNARTIICWRRYESPMEWSLSALRERGGTCCPRRTERKFYIPSQTLFLVWILLQILLVSWNARWDGRRMESRSACVALPSSSARKAYICLRRAAPSGGIICSMYATWTGARAIILKYWLLSARQKERNTLIQKFWLSQQFTPSLFRTVEPVPPIMMKYGITAALTARTILRIPSTKGT